MQWSKIVSSQSSKTFFTSACILALSACESVPVQPLPPEPQVDLQRFMGDWYVIANIPTFLEKNAYNAMDHYALDEDGTVATTYTFNADSFDGKATTYRSRGYVLSASNAVWGQQYIWPFKADYRIAYVSNNYSQTIIAREKRDYVWIMARTRTIPDADLAQLMTRVGELGYDTGLLQKSPQKSPGKSN